VVDRGEGGDGARLDAEILAQPLGFAEGETAGGADPAMQVLQVDVGVMLGDGKEELALLVDEKEVLGVGAVEALIEPARLLDREERLVPHGAGLDAKLVEEGEEIVGRYRHVYGSGRI